MSNIGFIGAGNMGSAILAGMILSKNFTPENIYVCDKVISEEVLSYGINTADIAGTTQKSDYVILAVKPVGMEEVLKEIKTVVGYEEKTYISIAAGYKIEKIEEILGNVKIIRVMPNICLKSLEGMTVLSANKLSGASQIEMAEKIFGQSGKTATVKESLIDACTAINGSGPAYVFMFIEALADAAVKNGIDRETAYLLSAQTVMGSAKLMLDTKMHPAKLKDMVCSPGGTTIEAVAELEQKGFRDAVISAVDACAKKAEKMSRSN